jgi:hypothetical protein
MSALKVRSYMTLYCTRPHYESSSAKRRRKIGRFLHFAPTYGLLGLKLGIHLYPVRTSQETHYVSATEPNRLMLFGETVAVYCENRYSPYLTGNTLRLRYTAQPVNAVWGNSRCLL